MRSILLRRILTALLATTFVVGCLAGCTSGENDTDASTEQTVSSETEAKESEPNETEAKESEPMNTETNAPQTEPAETSVIIKDTGIEGMDFIVEIPDGREPRILQITDTQMIRFSGIRGGSRYEQVKGQFFVPGDERSKDDNIRTWRYVEEGIERGKPDMIVLTGDNIYGETDDNGSLWTDFCNKMDSYKIPWAVVWGNHDNESQKGVRWQVAQVEASEYGMIKQNNTDKVNGKGGNSNFTVGIKQGEEMRYVFYFVDTNGARVKDNPGESLLANNPDIGIIRQSGGLDVSQRDWISASYTSITNALGKELPTMWFMHIPPKESSEARQNAYPDTYSVSPFMPNKNGDSGWATEGLRSSGFNCEGLSQVMKDTNCTGVFMGHLHNNSSSVEWDGIRFTFGVKTGTYDYFDYYENHIGTTLIVMEEDTPDFSVEYQYTNLELVPVNGPGYRV